jgi:hypothetical protein
MKCKYVICFDKKTNKKKTINTYISCCFEISVQSFFCGPEPLEQSAQVNPVFDKNQNEMTDSTMHSFEIKY